MRQRPPSTRRGGKQLTCFRWVDDAVHFLYMYVNVLYFHTFRLYRRCCMLQQHVVVRFSNHLCIRQYLSAVFSDICKMITSLQAMFFPVVFLQDLLSKMPKGGTLINTARVEVVHEADMLDVLKTRTDFCYLCDVAPKDIEPFKARWLTIAD